MKKVTIALIGAVVLAVGLVGGSQKAEAKTNSYNRVFAYVPNDEEEYTYDEVPVKSYEVKDDMIYVTTTYGHEYFGKNIVIERWSD